MGSWMRGRLGGFARVASAVLLLASVGCGEASSDSESIERTARALGSTKPQTSIGNWAQLSGMLGDGNYVLTADINANGQSWTPKYFTGTFDGGNRTISNLTINITDGANGGFFDTIDHAIIKNLRLVNLRVTSNGALVGGLAGGNWGSTVDYTAVEGTVTASYTIATGGFFGAMTGGSITRSYAKGTVNGITNYVGGLVGLFSGDRDVGINQSYAQVTVAPDTSNPDIFTFAGGIAGSAYATDIHDVYAVGNVTGRGAAGGLVGYQSCGDGTYFVLYRGIYRGDCVNREAPPGGWAGTVGVVDSFECTSRFDSLFWDRTLDPSSNWIVTPDQDQRGYTSSELRAPTTKTGAPFNAADAGWISGPWTAGTSLQHHVLTGMPGPNAQPR